MSRQSAEPSSLCSLEVEMSETAGGAAGPAGEPGRPRRRGGPIPMPAEERRSRTVAVNVSAEEWRELKAIAAEAEMPVRKYMRTRALGHRITPRRSADRVSPAAFEAAAALAALARELSELAEAVATGALDRPSPQVLAQLAERAHVAGLCIFGAAPDAE